MRPNKN